MATVNIPSDAVNYGNFQFGITSSTPPELPYYKTRAMRTVTLAGGLVIPGLASLVVASMEGSGIVTISAQDTTGPTPVGFDFIFYKNGEMVDTQSSNGSDDVFNSGQTYSDGDFFEVRAVSDTIVRCFILGYLCTTDAIRSAYSTNIMASPFPDGLVNPSIYGDDTGLMATGGLFSGPDSVIGVVSVTGASFGDIDDIVASVRKTDYPETESSLPYGAVNVELNNDMDVVVRPIFVEEGSGYINYAISWGLLL